MNRINYILFLLIFIIQQSLANMLSDIDVINKDILTPIKREDITQGMQNIPSANILKLQALLKESKIKIKLVLPLLLAGITEIYLNTYEIDKQYESCYEIEKRYPCRSFDSSDAPIGSNCYLQNKNNYILRFLQIYFLIDIVLSSSFIANKTFYSYIADPLSIILNICFYGKTYYYYLIYSIHLSKYIPLTGFISIYALISAFFSINYKINDSYSLPERIEEYEQNIHNRMQLLIPQNNCFDQVANLFLYISNNIEPNHCSAEGFYECINKNTIEDFYIWITQHKNDICLYKLINCSYTPSNLSTYYSQQKSDRANYKYQPGGVNHQTIHSTNSKITFKMVEQNNILMQDLLTRSLQKPGIKLIEVDSIDSKNKITYKYVGIINDNKNYYLVLPVELNNEITKSPATYREIIYNSIFNNHTDYPETCALVIKYDAINKIQSIMGYLFSYLDSNHHTCVYDVTLNNNQLYQQAK